MYEHRVCGTVLEAKRIERACGGGEVGGALLPFRGLRA
jgi:hypothetical protein